MLARNRASGEAKEIDMTALPKLNTKMRTSHTRRYFLAIGENNVIVTGQSSTAQEQP